MCTFSFVPKGAGYYVAMNRDEHLTRETADPPRKKNVGTVAAVYPEENSGGTWLASNAHGVTFALLNWNLAPRQLLKLRSRGVVIPQLLSRKKARDAGESLEKINLRGILPFRLFGVFPQERTLQQWRWDGFALGLRLLDWRPGHFFSSAISDEAAAEKRGDVCRAAWQASGSGSLSWLRELHQSHSPQPGAFSVCVHRPDASTVSYSEIVKDTTMLTFQYRAGSPCRFSQPVTLQLPLS